MTYALLAPEPGRPILRRPEGLFLGSVEVFVVLYLLDALFLVFVAIQARYLFGGAERVATVAGLTYAEYARGGFFELVAVTALILPVLLAVHWLFRPENRFHRWTFKALCTTMVALLFVIGASALQRMHLYYLEFGLTVPRLLATTFMMWLAGVFLWFVLTVLRDRRDRFAFGALVSALAAVLLLNAVSPDALVARVNVERMREGERFDEYYLTHLSADAAPVLIGSLPDMDGKDRRFVQRELQRSDRWRTEDADWRDWNLSRFRAHYLVETRLPEEGGVKSR